MFTVYKITNQINGKAYIGSSIRVEQRWRQEKNNAFNSNSSSYNYPLQCAFRKYGIENFCFEVLKNDFSCADEMEKYEREMILYYDTLNHGYNQTLYTHCALHDPQIKQKHIEKLGKKCALVDKNDNIIEIYSSLQEAGCIHFGENTGSTIKKICEGDMWMQNGKIFRYLDNNNNIIPIQHKTNKRRKPIVGISINDPSTIIYADSILEASQKYNLNRCSIEKCRNGEQRYSNVGGYIWREVDEEGNIIENELLIQDLIDNYNAKNPLINGERHNIKEWCKIYGISTNSVYQRIKKGMTVIEAITTPKRR